MEKDVVLGPEAQLKMSVIAGVVKLEVDYAGKQASAGLSVSMDVDQYLELLKAALPSVPSVIFDGLEGALKLIP